MSQRYRPGTDPFPVFNANIFRYRPARNAAVQFFIRVWQGSSLPGFDESAVRAFWRWRFREMRPKFPLPRFAPPSSWVKPQFFNQQSSTNSPRLRRRSAFAAAGTANQCPSKRNFLPLYPADSHDGRRSKRRDPDDGFQSGLPILDVALGAHLARDAAFGSSRYQQRQNRATGTGTGSVHSERPKICHSRVGRCSRRRHY